VLDASAVIALAFDEPGATEVLDIVEQGAALSPVNAVEVGVILQRRGWPQRHVEGLLTELNLLMLPFDRTMAAHALQLEPWARSAGLSLGDRACIATARMLDSTAVTSDRSWMELDPQATGVTVRLIR
jgi:PIN domain nuclease of toxin-antitoxin system